MSRRTLDCLALFFFASIILGLRSDANGCGYNCMKPWCPPDRWVDVNPDGIFDLSSGDYYHSDSSGYGVQDIGSPLTLVLGNGSEFGFGQFWYYSVDFPPINKVEFGPPITGADQYRNWICAGCLDNRFLVDVGDSLQVEPGRLVGPNGSGTQCLIDSDPAAEWDETRGIVINSGFAISPRIIRIPLFDPSIGMQSLSGRPYLEVSKRMTAFLESTAQGGTIITLRIIHVECVGVCSCPSQADMNADGLLNDVDLNGLIDVLFFGGTNPQDAQCPNTRADFDCSGAPDAVDLNSLIDHLFFGGSELCDPCQ